MRCLKQHGFLKQKFHRTHLFCLVDEVSSWLDEGIPAKACYFDFTEAFYSEDHSLLPLN